MLSELEALKMVPAYLVPAGILLSIGWRLLAAKDKANEELSKNYAASVEKIHADHRTSMEGIISRFWMVQENWKAEMKDVIDNYVTITKETISAVKGLELSVRELQGYMGLQRRPGDQKTE